MLTYSHVLIFFIFLETLNIILLYFFPQSTKGNAVGIFKAYEDSKAYPEIHAFIKYLIYWVAGTKLIFVALLIVIVIRGDAWTQLMSLAALLITTSTFYWKLYPIIKSLDSEGQLSVKGYSRTLAIMIATFLVLFLVALLYRTFN